MQKLVTVLFCVGLCITIGVLYPQVGTSNPDNDPTGCLVSGCHTANPGEGLHDTHSGFDCEVCHGDVIGGPVGLDDCLVCHLDEGGDLCDLVDIHGGEAGCLECHEICEEPPTTTTTIEPGDCAIDVIPDSLSKSHWYAIPTAFRIETIGILDLNLLTPVTIVCDADGESPLFKSVFKTGKVVLPNFGTNTTIILQTGLILPAWWTQSFDLESETCTVTVEGCADTDTFELEYMSILGIPLGN